MLASLILASLAAYAFARYRFPGSGALYPSHPGGAADPLHVDPHPGIRDPAKPPLDRHPSGAVRHVRGGLPGPGHPHPASVFCRGPGGASGKAASLDGAGEVQTMARVVAPLAMPAPLTVAIMTALTSWNDYLWPLIVLPEHAQMDRHARAGILPGPVRWDVGMGAAFRGVCHRLGSAVRAVLCKHASLRTRASPRVR